MNVVQWESKEISPLWKQQNTRKKTHFIACCRSQCVCSATIIVINIITIVTLPLLLLPLHSANNNNNEKKTKQQRRRRKNEYIKKNLRQSNLHPKYLWQVISD